MHNMAPKLDSNTESNKSLHPLVCRIHPLWFFGVSVLLLLLDWFSKKLAVDFLTFGYAKPIFPGFNLTLTHNYGMAFGILNNGEAWSRWLLTILACLISSIILRLIWRSEHKANSLGLSLILGGAIGNVIDRLNYGYVIDFLQVYVGPYYWPTFNIADAGITVGAIIIAVQLIWFDNAKDESNHKDIDSKNNKMDVNDKSEKKGVIN